MQFGLPENIIILIDHMLVFRLGSKVKLSWKLISISKSESSGYSLTYETPNGFASLQTKTVVMTVPSYVASDLLRPLSVCQT